MAHRYRKDAPDGELPTREDILAFIRDNPGSTGKREIARAFGVTGGARIALKRLLKEMAEDGQIGGHRKRIELPGELPRVVVADIADRDSDGELIALPNTWDDAENGAPPKILVLPDKKSKRAAPGMGDRVLLRLRKADDGDAVSYIGGVIKVLDRKPRGAIGIFRTTENGARIIPVDRKQSEMSVDAKHVGDAKNGDLVRVEARKIGRYGQASAKVTEVLGASTSEFAISTIALHSHDIPHEFPAPVIRAAKAAKPVSLDGREDWRDKPLLTIDPADAKDHDDAVMAEPDIDPKNAGGWIATVAIADVSWYVRPGSDMDREAQKRGNSVYFPDRVVPMLPEALSNDLCSLKEGVDRPALATRMVFDKTGRKKKHSFHRIMMRSPIRLAYEEAQDAIDGRPNARTKPYIGTVLKPLWDGYACLAKGRKAREPLDLDLPERKIVLDGDGQVDRVITPPRLVAHQLIEEFMIQANVAAAETLEERRAPVIYRVHDQPSLKKVEALREFLRSVDMKLAQQGSYRASHFNGILAKANGSDHHHVVNEVVLRSQSQAEYSPENIGHFGLNLRRYAHFTSPIRRYADLMVHRALVSALGLGEGGLQKDAADDLEEIAGQISSTERRAMAAERDTNDRLIAAWLAERIGAIFKGRIAGVTKAGLFIRLDETGADGFVPASTLGAEYFVYDEDRHALIGETSGETLQLGDRVSVKLVEAAPFAGSLRFELLSEGRKGRPPKRKPSRRRRHLPGKQRYRRR